LGKEVSLHKQECWIFIFKCRAIYSCDGKTMLCYAKQAKKSRVPRGVKKKGQKTRESCAVWQGPLHEEQALKPFDKIDCRIVLCHCRASERLRCIPEKRLFSFLSDVRLAKAFCSCGCHSKPIEGIGGHFVR
jgi:hypothetical protein